MVREQRLGGALVSGEERVHHLDPDWASGHEQGVHVAMPELQGRVVRRQTEPDRPAVDV
jgi:hypothetical protein